MSDRAHLVTESCNVPPLRLLVFGTESSPPEHREEVCDGAEEEKGDKFRTVTLTQSEMVSNASFLNWKN